MNISAGQRERERERESTCVLVKKKSDIVFIWQTKSIITRHFDEHCETINYVFKGWS